MRFRVVAALCLLVGVCLLPSVQSALGPARGRTMATATARVSLTVERCVFVTTMEFLPESMRLPTPGARPPVIPELVLATVRIPSTLRTADLHQETTKINGVPLAPRRTLISQIPAEWRQCVQSPRSGYLVLLFDRQAFINALGSTPGTRQVTLEMTVGGGHLLTASEGIRLLAPLPANPKKSDSKDSH